MAHYSERSAGILAVLADRPVGYHPKLAIALGGVKEGIFICQLLYWDGRGRDPDGWIWKTVKEMTEETGLSYGEQRGARTKLKKLGVLEEKRKGVPAKLWYRLDFEALGRVVEEAFPPENTPNQSSDQELRKSHIKSCESNRSITESTSENTSKGQDPVKPKKVLQREREKSPEPLPLNSEKIDNPGKVAPPPKKPIPPAVEAYRAAIHYYPRKHLWEMIDNSVGEIQSDLEFWSKVCQDYSAMGWNPINVKKMLEFYKKRQVPGEEVSEPAGFAACRSYLEKVRRGEDVSIL